MKKDAGFHSNRKLAIGLIFFALVAGAGYWFWNQKQVQSLGEQRLAKKFSLKNRKGDQISLDGLLDQAVLLHFWASWCAPCLEEIPRLKTFVEHIKGAPLRLVTVSLDTSWVEADRLLSPTLESDQWRMLLDPENKVPEAWGSYQYPETYLIARDGRIRAKWIGPQKWDQTELSDAIVRLAH